MKKAKTYELKTKYAECADLLRPWQDYPRPQFIRDSYLNLNGEWDFAITKSEKIPNAFLEKILVPFPPEAALSGIQREIKKGERMYYRRRVTLPDGFKRDRIILHVDACDQISEVYIDEKFVSKKEGGYTPHSVDITDYISGSSFELTIEATDDLDKKYPYGKQRRKRGGMWYTPVSGIWQTVWLESLPERPIESIKITTTAKNAKIEIKTQAEKKALTFLDGKRIEFSDDVIVVSPSNPHPWSPEDPYLYRFTLETETDKIESYFALREIGVTEEKGISRLTLNGEPYIFNGLLDQGYFPDGIFLPASSDGYADDIKTAKACGFNMLRKHIKIEPQIFYYLCDTLGIAVFQDMINNSDYSFLRDTALPTVGLQRLPDLHLHKNKKSREIFLEAMKEEVELLYSFPSILYYTIFNEGWGQFSSDEMYRVLKSLDTTRIIDSTSGWFRRKKSDVDSRHIYFKPLNPKKPDGRPLVISEFGGYSYRCCGHLFSEGNYGYRSFDDREKFEDALVALYENEVIPLAKKGASAFVYTQLSDVEDETNGLITYDRQVLKVNAERLSTLMQKLYKI